jgi:hypothetical protein
MITHRNTTKLRTSTTAEHFGRLVRSDSDSQAVACEFLTELIGSAPDDLEWDDTHHLQGHGHLDGHELVVIAPRDDLHRTIVLIAEDWDAVSRASVDQRRRLLEACAIADHNRLVAVLRDHWMSCRPLTVAA